MSAWRKLAVGVRKARGLVRQGEWRLAAAEIIPSGMVVAEAFLPLAFVALVSLFVALSTEQGRLEDLVQREANAHAVLAPDPDVVVVLVDDATRSAFGIGADSRAMLNCLIAQLERAQPRVIALDYVFGDQPRVPDIVPSFCREDGSRLRVPATAPLVTASVKSRGGGTVQEVLPSPAFVDLGRVHAGYAELVEDRQDGTVRGVVLASRDEASGEVLPSLALSTWLLASPGRHGGTAAPGPGELRRSLADCARGQVYCPDGPGQVQRIRFHSPGRALRLVSAATLFDGPCLEPGPLDAKCPLGLLRDRIVLVGSSHAEAVDHFRTPLFSDMPFAGLLFDREQEHPMLAGVIVHALAVQNLSDQRGFVRPLSTSARITLSALAMLLPILVAALLLAWPGRPGPLSRLIAGLVFVLAMLAVGYCGHHWAVGAMAENHRLVPLSLLLPFLGLGIVLAVLGAIWVTRARALASRDFVHRHAGHLAQAPGVANSILADQLRAGQGKPAAALAVLFDAGQDATHESALEIARLQRDLLAELPLAGTKYEGDLLPLLSPPSTRGLTLYLVAQASVPASALEALRSLRERIGSRPGRYAGLANLELGLHTCQLRVLELRDFAGMAQHVFVESQRIAIADLPGQTGQPQSLVEETAHDDVQGPGPGDVHAGGDAGPGESAPGGAGRGGPGHDDQR
jgi:CHASE2 domain-containing sensor protein